MQCCEDKPYPTNTFAAPSHLPGKGVGGFPGPLGPSHVDYSKFDIVKVHLRKVFNFYQFQLSLAYSITH